MKKNQARYVTVQFIGEGEEAAAEINEFHFEMIQRQLEGAHLSSAEKMAVIDQILEHRKAQKQR